VYGEEALNGIQLGMDIFSGQREQPVRELVVMDTAGDPARAVAALETMVREERVMTVIGPLSSRAAAAVAQRAEELGVPIIALTQKEGITEGKEMVFRNFLTPHREVDRVLEVALEAMGLKRYAILYPENSYGRHFMNLFWERVEKRGGVVTAVESYDPDETDFAEEIKKMIGTYYPRPASLTERRRNERPPEEEENRLNMEEPEPIVDFDAVFIPDSYTRVAMIAPQLVYHDVVDVQLLGSSLWQSPQLLEMSREYVQGALFPSGFHESSGMPGIRGFIETYTASFESPPGILAASGYDTVRFLEQVMSGQGVRTRSQLQKAILWSQGFDGVTGRIFFSFGGEVEKDPILLTVLGKRISMYR
jgi:ABC-type branched-subunit amino acid transport system substrate-binding protein